MKSQYTDCAVKLGKHGSDVRWGKAKRADRNKGISLPIVLGVVGTIIGGPVIGALAAGLTKSLQLNVERVKSEKPKEKAGETKTYYRISGGKLNNNRDIDYKITAGKGITKKDLTRYIILGDIYTPEQVRSEGLKIGNLETVTITSLADVRAKIKP